MSGAGWRGACRRLMPAFPATRALGAEADTGSSAAGAIGIGVLDAAPNGGL